ncbi:hypothetical protein BDA96_05G029000 [Sorghum bicolor]|uniref:Uncharacterized protein n=2 Tax=Sorghum bicolor TaxID=4558 RepID=A0A921UF10_SORBI|nr:hypothetical protein BDA96_05G029000 [Sorghum bicolor]KXG27688.1 hypothetical protein SORBI_3005G028000 [Sorghum bicolor]
MAIFRSRKQGGAKSTITSATWHACAIGGGTGKVPKGYVPMVLVDGEDDEQDQRILVPVHMLREPCMAPLLEMAEQQFGHGQPGVLRIPCSAIHFEHIVNELTLKAN